jgi:hypothetical protein
MLTFAICNLAANLSQKLPTWQSITLNNATASLAVDGSTLVSSNATCAQAGNPGTAGPWLAIDLGASRTVNWVVLWLPASSREFALAATYEVMHTLPVVHKRA